MLGTVRPDHGFKINSSHKPYGETWDTDRLLVISLFRDPVARSLSFIKLVDQGLSPMLGLPTNLTVGEMERYKASELHNGMVRRISGHDIATKDSLDLAIKRIQEFALVGTTERHDEFVERLYEGVCPVEVDPAIQHIGSSRQGGRLVTAKECRQIRQWNRFDYALHEEAKLLSENPMRVAATV